MSDQFLSLNFQSTASWIPSLRLTLSAVFLLGVFTQCETTDTGGSGGKVTVAGTLFYPDETGKTYLVPEGAQVIGASGTNCHYIVQSGASLVAHTGNGNTYKIENGGHFRGFAHPAENCTITFESGAIIEREETGPGTRFQPL
ncbi:MAG: hypothetical protein AAGA96_07280 [Verrucomicrobiota bacterium]